MPATKHLYTIAEYLALEEKSEGKNEYHDGEIIAMAGGSYRHSKLKTNLIRTLGNRLMGHRCEPLDSDMRVRVEKRLSYFYPDAQILCTPPTFDVDDPKKTTIVNPTVVFEVISESSEAYDRGEKFSMYRDM
ncbi:MAG TPA: Uma2 family endonuclease, partial [Tepidisphaeraceae bacterium]|nr:Uma2 family endonuclease [Tepidisphaeraceae bacterium]